MITDNQQEIFDIVDEDDRVIGQTNRKGANSNKNLIHRSIGVAIFNSKKELFLQQRSETKDTDPLKWTISCSGHVASDSSTIGGVMASQAQPATSPSVSFSLYGKTAHRELFEELGIRNLELEPVTKYICRAPNETEMVMLYKATYDGPFKLNKEEILQGNFFTQNRLDKLVQSGKLELSFMGKVALRKLDWL